jgi:hydrogenase maturation factor
MSDCHDDHCITCGDVAVEMRVLVVDPAGGLARCEDADGGESEVETLLVGDVAIGDALLVHAGTAIARATALDER